MPRKKTEEAPSMLQDQLKLVTAKADGALSGINKDIAALDKERATLVKKRDALEAKLKKQIDALEAKVDGLTAPRKPRAKRAAAPKEPVQRIAPPIRPAPGPRSSVSGPPTTSALPQ